MKFSSEPSFPLVCLMSDDGCLLDEDVQKGGTKFPVWMKSLNSARSGQSSNNSLKNYWTLFLCDARCLYHTANENVQFTGLHDYKYGKWSRVASTRNSDTWRWTQFKASSAITIWSTQHVLCSLLYSLRAHIMICNKGGYFLHRVDGHKKAGYKNKEIVHWNSTKMGKTCGVVTFRRMTYSSLREKFD